MVGTYAQVHKIYLRMHVVHLYISSRIVKVGLFMFDDTYVRPSWVMVVGWELGHPRCSSYKQGVFFYWAVLKMTKVPDP